MIKYLIEFIGTFIFLSVIMMKPEAIPIGVALAAVIFFGGGHYNPAVSVMMFANKSLNAKDLPMYIIAQILGGLAALSYYKLNK